LVSYEVIRAIEVDRDLVEKSSSLSAWVAGSRVTVKKVLAMRRPRTSLPRCEPLRLRWIRAVGELNTTRT